MGNETPQPPENLSLASIAEMRKGIFSTLTNLEKHGVVLEHNAKLLSDSIAEVTERLQAMPGKVYASIRHDSVLLEFDRFQNSWNILLTDGDSEEFEDDFIRLPLSQVSVLRKARAFPLIQHLLAQIFQLQRETLQQIETAFTSQSEAK